MSIFGDNNEYFDDENFPWEEQDTSTNQYITPEMREKYIYQTKKDPKGGTWYRRIDRDKKI